MSRVRSPVKPYDDLSPEADPRARAWRLLFERHAAIRQRLEAELRAATGMDFLWYDVLLHLAEAPAQKLRSSDLARAVVISKSGLTGLVDRMEGAGLVERRAVDGDRRGVEVSLTAEGRRRFEEAAGVHRAGIRREFLEKLTGADARALIRILEKL
jgi:DNA-binding MarR family transcriptional regulator